MRIIFLDINGVLINRKTNQTNFFYGLDQANVACLARLVEQTDAHLVLASTWRTEFDEHMQPHSSIAKGFVSAFQKYDLSLYDQTGHFGGGRRDEIFHWLENHDKVDSFVILDDTNFNWGVLSPYWVPVNSNNGLTEQNVESAKNILISTP